MTDNDPNIWREVFGPLGQVIAFFGGLGGLVNALVTRKPLRETPRAGGPLAGKVFLVA